MNRLCRRRNLDQPADHGERALSETAPSSSIHQAYDELVADACSGLPDQIPDAIGQQGGNREFERVSEVDHRFLSAGIREDAWREASVCKTMADRQQPLHSRAAPRWIRMPLLYGPRCPSARSLKTPSRYEKPGSRSSTLRASCVRPAHVRCRACRRRGGILSNAASAAFRTALRTARSRQASAGRRQAVIRCLVTARNPSCPAPQNDALRACFGRRPEGSCKSAIVG